MSVTFQSQYRLYCAQCGPLMIFDRDRKTAIQRILRLFAERYGAHA